MLQSRRLRSSTLSPRVAELCAWDGQCSYQAIWGCPPWWEEADGGQPRPGRTVTYFGRPIQCGAGLVVADHVRVVSEATLEISFVLLGKRFTERRSPLHWPWLCCNFRFRNSVF